MGSGSFEIMPSTPMSVSLWASVSLSTVHATTGSFFRCASATETLFAQRYFGLIMEHLEKIAPSPCRKYHGISFDFE